MRCFFLIAVCFLGFQGFGRPGVALTTQTQGFPNITCAAVFEFIHILDSNHVDPPIHDEQWARNVSSLLVNGLDPRNLYLSQVDLAKIQALESKLVTDFQQNTCEFQEAFQVLFKQNLQSFDSLLEVLEQQSFRYTESDPLIWFPGKSASRAKNWEDHIRKWKKNIKARVLYKASELQITQDGQAFQELAARTQVEEIKKLRCELLQISEYEEGYETFFMGKFMDAISASYDPHSGYYSLSEKELWDLALSTQSYSFGLAFEKSREGQLQIAQLNPGGPAWKSQSLHQGDEILEIEYPKGNKLDIYCLSIAALAKELKSSRSNSIYLTIKKGNGEVHSLSLVKEKLRHEENVINSFLLEGQHKVGYIYLPAFYTESEEEISKGCADDVARELLRLQAEGIEGLILDLRFNGGGSMKEALNLAGIFIDRGPLAIYEEKGGKATQLKDMNRGSLYDGPMVLLINGYSASASEILASALQDYERAVIVGSRSFGKSSGQIMLPVVGAGLGMAKVSIQRYYRIQGGSYQLKGVIPDIVLPNTDQIMGSKERDYLRPFSHSQAPKKAVYQKVGNIPYGILADNSKDRVSQKQAFQEIIALNKSLEYYKNQGLSFILTPEKFPESLAIQQKLLKPMQNTVSSKSELFQPENNSLVESLLSLEPGQKIINEAQRRKIHSDIYIEESFLILQDLIEE